MIKMTAVDTLLEPAERCWKSTVGCSQAGFPHPRRYAPYRQILLHNSHVDQIKCLDRLRYTHSIARSQQYILVATKQKTVSDVVLPLELSQLYFIYIYGPEKNVSHGYTSISNLGLNLQENMPQSRPKELAVADNC